MSKKTWTITVILIISTLVSVALYSNYKAKNIDVVINEREQAVEEVVQRSDITINTKHQYKDGVHTYIGTFETPNPCYLYETTVRSLERNINSDRLIEITYSEDPTNQICSQVITERDFKISFEASKEDINVDATVNGKFVNLNIFEVNPDIDIDEFEIFSKG